jgi:hypothetical protein
MEVKKNDKLIERKHFLIRAWNNGNIEPSQYYKEIAEIEDKIKDNLIEAMGKCKEEMISDIEQAKKDIKSDGNFKRTIASFIIKILKEQITDSEIKGVFRQGYKIMRGM